MGEEPDLGEMMLLLGKVFLMEMEKGKDGKSALFARAFLACRRLKVGGPECRDSEHGKDDFKTLLRNFG
jgi:hypothetical protein